MSLDGLSALQVPKGTGPVSLPPLSLTAWSRGSDEECMALVDIPTQVSGRESGFAIWELEGLNSDYFFSWQMGFKRRRGHVFSEGWPWQPGEFMSSRLFAEFSQNMHYQESWRLSASAELGDLSVGVNVCLVSTLQMAWCESNFTSCIDPLSAQPPHLFWYLNTSLLHLHPFMSFNGLCKYFLKFWEPS